MKLTNLFVNLNRLNYFRVETPDEGDYVIRVTLYFKTGYEVTASITNDEEYVQLSDFKRAFAKVAH